MILELDVGNSRIKWRLIELDASAVVDEGHVANFSELSALPELAVDVRFARMCSVRPGEENAQIEQWLRERYESELARARVEQSCGGVTNQYADVSRLGIDRWLAMLAAYRRAQGACLIIDSGTAFTLDIIDENGLHLGGFITPGLQLMRDSLENNTAIRLSDEFSAYSTEPGQSTDEAVFNGTLNVLLAAIEREVRSRRSLGAARVFFAGGDAALLHELAGIEGSEVVPSLVFEGLDVACPVPDLAGRS